MKRMLVLCAMLSLNGAHAAPPPAMNSARVLVTQLRGGDYLHVGDREAIDRVISRAVELAPEIRTGHCLDVGSGFGGTAQYIYNLNFHSIYGIDLDEAAIEYAKKAYPKIRFGVGNANQISKFFEPDFFSFIYIFNVLYAIEDKAAVLKQLFRVAKPGALLAIFDYSAAQESYDLKDLAGKPMYPILLSQMAEDLNSTGWDVVEIVDLSSDFITWYAGLLERLEQERPLLSQQFSQADISRVHTTYTTLHGWLKDSQMGGVLIFARKSDRGGTYE